MPDATIAIAGERAATLGEQLASAGGPPLSVEADRFALLTDDFDPPRVGRIRDLPESSVDLAILRRAWSEPADVFRAISVAREVVRPGGEVVVADVAADRLLDGSNHRYPIRLLYALAPVAAERLRSSTAGANLLGPAAVSAGLKRLEVLTYDEVYSEYADASELWSGVQRRGWRGAQWVESGREGALFEAFAPALQAAIPLGPAVDREPWLAAIGQVG